MLDRYFVRPTTVDRIRSSWLGEPLERYVAWLAEHGYAARNVHSRVPVVVRFGAFAAGRGAHTIADLPAQIDDFVDDWLARKDHRRYVEPTRLGLRKEIRGPIDQFLRVVLPEFHGRGRSRRHRPMPFPDLAPRFFTYLRDERGLRETSIDHYRFYL